MIITIVNNQQKKKPKKRNMQGNRKRLQNGDEIVDKRTQWTQ
jgi:hypothetical protein